MLTDMITDKQQELLNDITTSGESNCCGAKVYSPSDEWAWCTGCNEYCDIVNL